MLPKTHILVGFIVSLFLFLLFPHIGLIGFIIIFLSSVLIDFDHYLYFVYKTRDWSLNHAYNWFFNQRKRWNGLSIKQKEKYKRVIMIFHGVELLGLLLLLIFLFNGILSNILLFISIGIIIHLILDFIELYMLGESFYIKTSQIYTFISNKKRQDFN